MKKTIEETTRLLIQGVLTKDEADKILLDLHDVSNGACKYYTAGNNTAMNCSFCGKHKSLHGC